MLFSASFMLYPKTVSQVPYAFADYKLVFHQAHAPRGFDACSELCPIAPPIRSLYQIFLLTFFLLFYFLLFIYNTIFNCDSFEKLFYGPGP